MPRIPAEASTAALTAWYDTFAQLEGQEGVTTEEAGAQAMTAALLAALDAGLTIDRDQAIEAKVAEVEQLLDGAGGRIAGAMGTAAKVEQMGAAYDEHDVTTPAAETLREYGEFVGAVSTGAGALRYALLGPEEAAAGDPPPEPAEGRETGANGAEEVTG